MHIPSSGSLDIDDFNYHLPGNRIAKFPLENRADSRLLIYNKGSISHSGFTGITRYIKKDELIIFNNTRVIQARILMNKDTGAKIEIFLLEPLLPADYETAFSVSPVCRWKCMTGNKKRWKGGSLTKTVFSDKKHITLSARIISDHGAWQDIEFSWEPEELPFSSIIESAGLTPIPPYLNRTPEAIDRIRYQTVYSRSEGSVAAPTAGLHFTDKILNDLKNRKTEIEQVTLHVGAGTFKPVKNTNLDCHRMHAEHFYVSARAIKKLKNHKGPVTAVGTTTVRTLESIYWLGVNNLVKNKNELPPPFVSQKENRRLVPDIPVNLALEALEERIYKEGWNGIEAKTQLMIIPGYRFRIVNKMITNFHQPKSTLLLLVAAFIGDDWRKVYDYALNNNFRFLSYGDSSLLIP